MRIAVIIVRVLMGLMFLFASVVFFFDLMPQPELTGKVKVFNEGLAVSGIMTLVKALELICGIFLVSGFFIPLITVIIFPITLNIFMFHAFLAPQGLLVAILMLAGNLFLAYYYRKNYEPMFAAK